MSKSRGNTVSPEQSVETYGADALRLAILQAKPPADDVDWEDLQMEGCDRFLNRVWRLAATESDLLERVRTGATTAADQAVETDAHRLIDRTTGAYERWAYNTAVAGFMEFTNSLYKYVQSDQGPQQETLDLAVDTLLLLLMAPAVPHITAELWARRHDGEHIHLLAWPEADPAELVVDSVTMVVQVDGKIRDRLEVPPDIAEAEAEAAALASERVQAQLNGGEPRKVIVRVPKLVNIVV